MCKHVFFTFWLLPILNQQGALGGAVCLSVCLSLHLSVLSVASVLFFCLTHNILSITVPFLVCFWWCFCVKYLYLWRRLGILFIKPFINESCDAYSGWSHMTTCRLKRLHTFHLKVNHFDKVHMDKSVTLHYFAFQQHWFKWLQVFWLRP